MILFIFLRVLPRTVFINIMRHARCLIGNSSMGILESALYQLPVINMGNRQKGRLHAGNVEFVNYDQNDIFEALDKACFNKAYREHITTLKNPYGNGQADDIIVNFLDQVDFKDNKWYIKENLC